MLSSPKTISLALIAKNEEKNINRLLDSVEGCMDEIILVDTGSTDRTVEIAKERGCKVFLFDWVNDFSKARNYAFSKCTMDYILWQDLDDVLVNKEGFINWKKMAMPLADCFLATYHYALDKDGTPVCSFVRERVFKRSINPTWRYPIHEGVVMQPGWITDQVPKSVWTVNHLRDHQDIQADKSRNLNIFEDLKRRGESWDGRLQFYYGKELYEAQKPMEALAEFKTAITMPLEIHDKVLAYQYGAYSAMSASDFIKDDQIHEKHKYLNQAIEMCHEGLKLDPNRAEFHVNMGDCYLKMGNMINALPCYGAAKSCLNKGTGGAYEGAIYSFLDCYGKNPSLQIARINFHLGRIEESRKEAQECFDKYQSQEARDILNEIERITPLITIEQGQKQTDDIVFSCPPHQAYPFDEEIYETKPLGGSETALVQIAKELKVITGRPVKVFNQRETDLVSKSGVEYISNKKLNEYMSKNKPHTHIAWRHNIKITNSPTYLWSHDLFTQTVESVQNFDKMLCLSQYHKELTMGKCGVPSDKIIVTRNGITPEKFVFDRPHKNPYKFVYMSSPDRGLYGSILVASEVRKIYPEVELHVYYGLENLRKYGLTELADRIDGLIKDRPWVKVHGFTEQNQMYKEVADASIWLHPATFFETFAITAIEMLALGVYPVTRRLAGLGNTLAEAESKNQATLLEFDNLTHYITEPEIVDYTLATLDAIKEQKWRNVSLDLNHHSWHAVSMEWCHFMNLGGYVGK